jgi:hypothetical protein
MYATRRRRLHMLHRFLSGLVHPFIHVAYGLEFGVLEQVEEVA